MSLQRWLPSPMLSLALLIMWLLLNVSVSPGQIVLGGLLAIAAPLLTRTLRPLAPVAFRKPVVLARLLTKALIEIIRSCFNVSQIILFSKSQGLNSQFIRVPLDLQHPHGLALLSCLINSTPGTVWVEIIPGSHDLALHVFDLHNEQWWVDTIKTRYEKPLIEIFDHV